MNVLIGLLILFLLLGKKSPSATTGWRTLSSFASPGDAFFAQQLDQLNFSGLFSTSDVSSNFGGTATPTVWKSRRTRSPGVGQMSGWVIVILVLLFLRPQTAKAGTVSSSPQSQTDNLLTQLLKQLTSNKQQSSSSGKGGSPGLGSGSSAGQRGGPSGGSNDPSSSDTFNDLTPDQPTGGGVISTGDGFAELADGTINVGGQLIDSNTGDPVQFGPPDEAAGDGSTANPGDFSGGDFSGGDPVPIDGGDSFDGSGGDGFGFDGGDFGY